MTELDQHAPAADAPATGADVVSHAGIAGILVYLAAVAVGLMYFLIRLWPEAVDATGAWSKQVIVFWRAAPIQGVSDDMRLLLLVIVTGGLGSFIHASTSFVDYVGNRRFVRSWMLWYLMRPLIGSALALVLYVAVRGGLLTATAGAGASPSVSPYGVASLGCLAGMFSKQATDKLNEMFTTLFKTGGGDATRKDKLESTPKVESIEPAQLRAGGPVDVALNGSGFESAAIVRIGGQPRPTTFVSATRVLAKVATSDIAVPGTITVTVDNPSGHSSTPVTVTVA